eukprot:SAG31_NODE_1392_length_8533_cov_3.382974_7_plen_77_part_00
MHADFDLTCRPAEAELPGSDLAAGRGGARAGWTDAQAGLFDVDNTKFTISIITELYGFIFNINVSLYHRTAQLYPP